MFIGKISSRLPFFIHNPNQEAVSKGQRVYSIVWMGPFKQETVFKGRRFNWNYFGTGTDPDRYSLLLNRWLSPCGTGKTLPSVSSTTSLWVVNCYYYLNWGRVTGMKGRLCLPLRPSPIKDPGEVLKDRILNIIFDSFRVVSTPWKSFLSFRHFKEKRL